MKKSEIYNLAMIAVVDSDLRATEKLKVVESLMADRNVAEYVEKAEEEDK